MLYLPFDSGILKPWTTVVTVSRWYDEIFQNWLTWYRMLDLDMNLVMIAEDQETYKKYAQDSATDSLIDELLPGDVDDVVNRLREKRLASDMLVRIVERLHEREISAKG